MKRSNAPIFWTLFGAGGMLAALVGAMLVYLTGIAGPARIGLPAATMDYAQVLAFARHPASQLVLFGVIALFLWHAAHRIYHSLHDLGVHVGLAAKLACYGSAMAGTLATVVALWRLG
ncbi:MAG TPA: fumarate reductase subunit FrdD [Pseudomonadales bacterium]|nr:fumarate reductase subunit FrdD [Pseudomonadales bacterium]